MVCLLLLADFVQHIFDQGGSFGTGTTLRGVRRFSDGLFRREYFRALKRHR